MSQCSTLFWNRHSLSIKKSNNSIKLCYFIKYITSVADDVDMTWSLHILGCHKITLRCHTKKNFNSLRPSDAYMFCKLTIIGSDNGLSPRRHQAIIWTNAGILLIWTLRNKLQRNINRNWDIFIQENHLKMSSGKYQPFCLALDVLTHWGRVTHYVSVNYPSLVQIMPCCLVGAKPLSEPMLEYC